MNERCGTPIYIAPEILKDEGYEGVPVDIWSVGIVRYTMLYGDFPFHADSVEELENLVLQGQYALPDEITESARDLLSRILTMDPGSRITIPEIYAHPWMQNIDYSSIMLCIL